MTIQLQNRKAISNYILNYGKEIEAALILNLEVLVTELENHAKNSAGYDDVTGNLRGSIGGVVLKDGRPITYKGFTGEGEGVKQGKDFINTLINNFGSGYVIILVAGMEYASYVEDYHNLNVLKKSELKMNRELPKVLARLKQKIK